MVKITNDRSEEIACIQKLQKFERKDQQITYLNTKNCLNLAQINQQELDQKLSLKIGQIAIIVRNLFDHMLKIYQIANISLLKDENILIDFQDGKSKWQVSFVNLHETTVVTYEENYNNLLQIIRNFFLNHKQYLLDQLNDDNRNVLRHKIEWVTIVLNDILNILKSRRHHLDIIMFVRNNVKDETYQHNVFKDDVRLDNQPVLQQIEQPKVVQQDSKPITQPETKLPVQAVVPKTFQPPVTKPDPPAFKKPEISPQLSVQQPQVNQIKQPFLPPNFASPVQQQQTITQSQFQQSKAIDPQLFQFYHEGLKQLDIKNEDLMALLLKFCSTQGKNNSKEQAKNILDNIYNFLIVLFTFIDDSIETLEIGEEKQTLIEELKDQYKIQWELVLKSIIENGNTKFLEQTNLQATQFAESQLRTLIKDIKNDIEKIVNQY